MVLSFLQAPKGYTIFAANATGALKLVGEAFPFQKHSSFVLGTDSHKQCEWDSQIRSRTRRQCTSYPLNSYRRLQAISSHGKIDIFAVISPVVYSPLSRIGCPSKKLPGFYVEHLDLPTLVSTPDDLGSIMGHSEITVVIDVLSCPPFSNSQTFTNPL